MIAGFICLYQEFIPWSVPKHVQQLVVLDAVIHVEAKSGYLSGAQVIL